jgi:hypothetical protein
MEKPVTMIGLLGSGKARQEVKSTPKKKATIKLPPG